MALIYGLIRAIAFALLKNAAWKHRRTKSQLEKADKAFREIENSCKAEEVAVGRPANFASQFKLMKLFEVRDGANDRWKKAANRLKNRQRISNWLKAWNGKKIPYSFGLIDMSLALSAYHWISTDPERWSQVSEFIARLY